MGLGLCVCAGWQGLLGVRGCQGNTTWLLLQGRKLRGVEGESGSLTAVAAQFAARLARLNYFLHKEQQCLPNLSAWERG